MVWEWVVLNQLSVFQEVPIVLSVNKGPLDDETVSSLTPVERAWHGLSSTVAVATAIAATFHDINLTTQRPDAVDGIFGHHPNGGPEPIAFWNLGHDFNSTVLDRFGALRSQTSWSYGIYDCEGGNVGVDAAFFVVILARDVGCASAIASVCTGQVQMIAGERVKISQSRLEASRSCGGVLTHCESELRWCWSWQLWKLGRCGAHLHQWRHSDYQSLSSRRSQCQNRQSGLDATKLMYRGFGRNRLEQDNTAEMPCVSE